MDENGNASKQTPLHWAASRGLVQVADCLLTQNPPADIHKGDSLGYQAIHYAAQSGTLPPSTLCQRAPRHGIASTCSEDLTHSPPLRQARY